WRDGQAGILADEDRQPAHVRVQPVPADLADAPDLARTALPAADLALLLQQVDCPAGEDFLAKRPVVRHGGAQLHLLADVVVRCQDWVRVAHGFSQASTAGRSTLNGIAAIPSILYVTSTTPAGTSPE